MKTFGVDTPTPDNPTSKTYPCHMMCRRNSITHYENLANLDQVANKRFTYIQTLSRVANGMSPNPTQFKDLSEENRKYIYSNLVLSKPSLMNNYFRSYTPKTPFEKQMLFLKPRMQTDER